MNLFPASTDGIHKDPPRKRGLPEDPGSTAPINSPLRHLAKQQNRGAGTPQRGTPQLPVGLSDVPSHPIRSPTRALGFSTSLQPSTATQHGLRSRGGADPSGQKVHGSSMRTGAHRCERVRTGANQCESVRTSASRCETVRIGANRRE